jgi:hypothetical protein
MADHEQNQTESEEGCPGRHGQSGRGRENVLDTAVNQSETPSAVPTPSESLFTDSVELPVTMPGNAESHRGAVEAPDGCKLHNVPVS